MQRGDDSDWQLSYLRLESLTVIEDDERFAR